MLAQNEYINFAAWQIDNLERLLAKIRKDSKQVFFMILNLQTIYTKYFD